MNSEKKLRQNLTTEDICLLRFGIGSEKKSLLATVIEIDEFSEYHPIKFVCKIDADQILLLTQNVPVSLVIKKSELHLYLLLKGNVFQKSNHNGFVILTIDDVQLFQKVNKNNISSFKKIKDLSILHAA